MNQKNQKKSPSAPEKAGQPPKEYYADHVLMYKGEVVKEESTASRVKKEPSDSPAGQPEHDFPDHVMMHQGKIVEEPSASSDIKESSNSPSKKGKCTEKVKIKDRLAVGMEKLILRSKFQKLENEEED